MWAAVSSAQKAQQASLADRIVGYVMLAAIVFGCWRLWRNYRNRRLLARHGVDVRVSSDAASVADARAVAGVGGIAFHFGGAGQAELVELVRAVVRDELQGSRVGSVGRGGVGGAGADRVLTDGGARYDVDADGVAGGALSAGLFDVGRAGGTDRVGRVIERDAG